MKFEIIRKSNKNKSRLGKITTAHGEINTPVFMPVGTVGAVKGISPRELDELGAEIILGNTYHLYLRPGEKLVKKMGGLQKFNGWNRPILTDSGGYQVFSLGKAYLGTGFDDSEEHSPSLVKITDEGVRFKSFIDGSEHFFTPEKVIDIQLDLGSDIIMPLDYCPSAEADKKEIEKAVDLTSKWFKIAFEHFQKKVKDIPADKRPALFAIVQGGTHKDLREKSYNFLSQFDVDGWAIGGVANAGESKEKQHSALEYTLPLLPEDKPRYLMGVGEPEDLIYATSQGIDMFDCVLPTRLGRHGTVWICDWNILSQKDTVDFSSEKSLLESRPVTPEASGDHAHSACDTLFDDKTSIQLFEKLDLRKAGCKEVSNPIMEGCDCYACQNFSRSYIHHLIKEKEILGLRLTSLHNLSVLLNLMKKIRSNLD